MSLSGKIFFNKLADLSVVIFHCTFVKCFIHCLSRDDNTIVFYLSPHRFACTNHLRGFQYVSVNYYLSLRKRGRRNFFYNTTVNTTAAAIIATTISTFVIARRCILLHVLFAVSLTFYPSPLRDGSCE